MMKTVITCKAGSHYRIPATGTTPALHLRKVGLFVQLGDAKRLIATYPIERFGGELTPDTVRQFLQKG